MNKNKDRLIFSWKTRDDFKGWNDFFAVMRVLEQSFLPKPSLLEATDMSEKAIDGFLNEKVQKAINRKKFVVMLSNQKLGLKVLVNQKIRRGFTFISAYINTNFISQYSVEKYFHLFHDINKHFPSDYAMVHLEEHQKVLIDEVYCSTRTFLSNGLYWLNFFGNDELEKQGGAEAIMANPYITKAERFDNGLFVQVGESPFDCLTPEGEQQLVNATKALPPVKE